MIILNDFNTSVKKALSEIDLNWKRYDGLIICGTHNPNNTEGLIDLIKTVRENEIPYLGICFGHQLACIEYCRNVLGIKDATSEELNKCEIHTFQVKDYFTNEPLPEECTCGTFVIKKMKELKVGLIDGESYWNNYEIDPVISKQWHKPKHFITCQFHPEYQNSKDRPHELLVKFLEICKKRSPV